MQGSLPNLNQIRASWQAHGQNVADEIAARVAAYAPVGNGETSGRLRDSIHGEAEPTGDGVTVTVTSDVPEAAFVIGGTAPHDIDPRHPMEALFWPGAEHPYAHVHHPGTQANPFAEQAQDEIQSVIQDEWALVLSEAGVS